MSNEQVANDDKDVDKKTDVVVESSSNTEVDDKEAKAREMGWKPEAEFEGDKNTWVNADEFLRRAPLFEGLHKANRTIKKLEKQLAVLSKHHEDVDKAAYERAKQDLLKAKKQAAEEGDVKKVVEVDEALDVLKEKQSVRKVDSSNDDFESFEEWKEEQSAWYGKDEDMTVYANGIGSTLENKNPEWSKSKLLKEVAKRTKEAFKHRLENPNRTNAAKVNGSTGANGTGVKNTKLPTFSDLPKEAQDIYRALVKSKSNPRGTLTSEQYIRDYALKAGLIKDED